MKETAKRIEKVKAMIAEYKAMKAEDDQLMEAMWIDEKSGTYNCGRLYEWSNHNDKLLKYEKKVTRAVKNLCKSLNYNIKKDTYVEYHLMDIIEEVETRYQAALKAMQDCYWATYISYNYDNN